MAVSEDQFKLTQSASMLQMQDVLVGRRHTLVLTGELDIAVAGELERTIVRLCETGVESITLDLDGLTFIDSTGLKALISAHNLCQSHGYEFLLTPGSPAVQRVFSLTGATELLPFTS